MIGRGSRLLPDKKDFSVIDLGNNLNRFGFWDDPIDWMHIFRHPEIHLQNIRSDEEIEHGFKYVMPEELRERFAKSENIEFDVQQEHEDALVNHHRPRVVIDKSIAQHVRMCMENSNSLEEAVALSVLLREEIEYRVRVYSRCLSKSSESYVKWLQDEYKRNLKSALFMKFIEPVGGSESDYIEDSENEDEASEEF